MGGHARAFRPEIYFNYSGDGGKTWLSQDLKADTAAARQAATPRLAADGQGGFRMAWIGYDDQARKQGKLYTTVIRPAERVGVAPAERPPDMERLRERVSRFWEARKRSDWGDNHELTDPFFRLGVTREGAFEKAAVRAHARVVDENGDRAALDGLLVELGGGGGLREVAFHRFDLDPVGL